MLVKGEHCLQKFSAQEGKCSLKVVFKGDLLEILGKTVEPSTEWKTVKIEVDYPESLNLKIGDKGCRLGHISLTEPYQIEMSVDVRKDLDLQPVKRVELTSGHFTGKCNCYLAWKSTGHVKYFRVFVKKVGEK